jgi:hypothetical protein
MLWISENQPALNLEINILRINDAICQFMNHNIIAMKLVLWIRMKKDSMKNVPFVNRHIKTLEKSNYTVCVTGWESWH